jgi:hypothetical protein
MELNLDFSTYTLWSLYATIAFFLLAVLGFIFKWGFRFRFVGVTGFFGVLTVGLFALSLALFNRVEIEGAVKFNLVYDTGANQAVIAVPLDITPSQLDATLQQAAIDLFSYGRNATNGDSKLTIRARTQVHGDGFTYPIYLGQIKHSLFQRDDADAQVTIFTDEFTRLNSLTNG